MLLKKRPSKKALQLIPWLNQSHNRRPLKILQLKLLWILPKRQRQPLLKSQLLSKSQLLLKSRL